MQDGAHHYRKKKKCSYCLSPLSLSLWLVKYNNMQLCHQFSASTSGLRRRCHKSNSHLQNLPTPAASRESFYLSIFYKLYLKSDRAEIPSKCACDCTRSNKLNYALRPRSLKSAGRTNEVVPLEFLLVDVLCTRVYVC